MQRVRKVLHRFRPPSATTGHGLIDFHTGNDFQYADRELVDAVSYMGHWAYVDSLWIGEGFSYDSAPVYWLAEISGLPFGVFSDMLGKPNAYRGMLFGSTGRPGCADPSPMWHFWDSFGITDSDMLGWWLAEAPVAVAGQPDPFSGGAQAAVLATSYVIPGNKTLVALASWAPATVSASLVIDWAALGLDAARVTTVVQPAIAGFQPAASYTLGSPIAVEPKKGALLVIAHDA